MTERIRTALPVLAALATAPLAAQTLVRDIDPTSPATSTGSFASDFAPLGTRYLFTANHPSGKQIFITDGTPAGTQIVTQQNPLTDFLQPQLTDGAERNGVRYFRCSSLRSGTEIWRSDGTRAGTHLFVDLVPGVQESSPRYFAEAGGLIYFSATTPACGEELWVTDGTVAGTRCLDLVPGPGDSRPFWIRRFGNRVVARADGEPWISDGTPAGTFRLADIQPGAAGSWASEFVEFNGRAWFWAGDPTIGDELWSTDGTPAGTSAFADLRPGSDGSYPSGLTVAGGVLFFAADDGVHGRELWKTDGTVAGTALVADLEPGAYGADPLELTALGNRLLFSAYRAADGREPWTSDGTATGTRLVRNINPSGGSDIRGMTVLGDRLLFHVDLPSTGREPWISDGTAAGTRAIADIWPGAPGSITVWNDQQLPFAALGSGRVAVFAADDGTHGAELWRTDGSAAGTWRLSDIADDLLSSGPTAFGRCGSTAYFSATDLDHGRELWAIPVLDTADSLAAAYGRGCDGSNGVRPRLVGDGAPFVGNPAFALDVSDALVNTPGALLLNVQARERPLSPSPGCAIYPLLPAVDAPFATGPAGAATIRLAVPALPALRGVELFAQGFVLDPGGGWASTFAVTNPVHLLVGD